MYILDTRTVTVDSEVQSSMIMLELYNKEVGVGDDDTKTKATMPSIRPVFALPGNLETKWFKLNAEEDWFVFFRSPDDFLAILEVDL